MDKALNLLLAGIVIVFFVLVLLIVIIKIYGTIVQTAQNRSKNKKDTKQAVKSDIKKVEQAKTVPQPNVAPIDDAIPGEVIAVIAAAVDAMYDKPVKIKSVKRSRANSGSSWRNAGLFENTKPF